MTCKSESRRQFLNIPAGNFKKSTRRLPIGDKHKTSAVEGVVYLHQRLAYDLEPMAPEAGQITSSFHLENLAKF